MHLNCWSFRCSWSIACRRCSNYIFILHLTLGFNILRKDNCKPRRERFEFGDLVRLILEALRYMLYFQVLCVPSKFKYMKMQRDMWTQPFSTIAAHWSSRLHHLHGNLSPYHMLCFVKWLWPSNILVNISSAKGMVPNRRQAINLTIIDVLKIRPLMTV